jgi:glucose/arabinose dehydrogenase
MMKKIVVILPMLISFMIYPQNIDKIKMPTGFTISIFARGIASAREMSLSPDGTLFVGSMTGNVYAITENKSLQTADKIHIIAKNLEMPVGVSFYKGDLYVSAVSRILKYAGIENRLDDPPAPTIVNGSFPTDTHHGWKFIGFGPDGRLYVPVGAPCNICLEKDRRYASIMRMNPDGTGLEVFADGIRNTVGFDWDPATGFLWFTDNGRDGLGDNTPPDELNKAYVKGLNFGFPFIHGKNLFDPEFGKKGKGLVFSPPEMQLGPHVASLGMRFYTGDRFPARYRNGIFIAEHGSWDRSAPIGYRITFVSIQNGKAVSYETFASGWLSDGRAWGRPVDVEIMKDGSMLVSDDKAGVIYRINFTG